MAYKYLGFALIQIYSKILHSKFFCLDIAGSSLVIFKGEYTKVNDVHSANPVKIKKEKNKVSK